MDLNCLRQLSLKWGGVSFGENVDLCTDYCSLWSLWPKGGGVFQCLKGK